ncbi:MAG: hypothetical protein H7Z43_14335 [Clostridia bacterium]|nr:hypothetical protein [Deltaproteobacteria bacterium]
MPPTGEGSSAYVLDACCAINLDNAGVLAVAARVVSLKFIGPVALGEVRQACLAPLLDSGDVELLDDSAVDAAQFIGAMTRWGLGLGETECILFAEQFGHGVATDDRKARTVVTERLGRSRLIGSIGVLRRMAVEKVLTWKTAYDAYLAILKGGAFLPELTPHQFRVLQ